jgi:hypothetical protein
MSAEMGMERAIAVGPKTSIITHTNKTHVVPEHADSPQGGEPIGLFSISFLRTLPIMTFQSLNHIINTILYSCCYSVAIFARGHLEPMEQKSWGGIAAMGV